MKIKKGDWFRCIKTSVSGFFTDGRYYQTEEDGRITVIEKNSGYSGHVFSGGIDKSFIKLYTIQDLKDGIVAVANDGTLWDLNKVLVYAFKRSFNSTGYHRYYFKSEHLPGRWFPSTETTLPIQSVKDFLVQLPKEEKAQPTQETKDKLDKIAEDAKVINPKHYAFNIKGTQCDVFDIANAMGLNIEQSTALRYFRKKENQIEDTKKAIKCLQRLVERLERDRK